MVPRDGFDFVERWPRYVAGKIEDVMSSENEKCEGVAEDTRPFEFDEATVQQLTVGRHFKMANGGNSIVFHASAKSVGIWMGGRFSRSGFNQIGMYADERLQYFMVYPDEKYWNHGVKQKLPFAVSTVGIQIPHPDGTVTQLKFEEIAELVKAFKK
jgi:hypothetical protein